MQRLFKSLSISARPEIRRLLGLALGISVSIGLVAAISIGGLHSFRGSDMDRALKRMSEAGFVAQEMAIALNLSQPGMEKRSPNAVDELIARQASAFRRLTALEEDADAPPGAQLHIQRLRDANQAYIDTLIRIRKDIGDRDDAALMAELRAKLWPRRLEVQKSIVGLTDHYRAQLEAAYHSGDRREGIAVGLIAMLSAIALFTLFALGWVSNRLFAERKRQEDLLADLLHREQDARKLAEKAVQDRDEVLAVVSHDLKNPLLSIVLKSELMENMKIDDPAASSLVKASAGTIHRAANRMSELIQGMLDIALIEAGRLRIEPEAQPLAPLMAELREIFEPLAEERRIQVDWRLNGPVTEMPLVAFDRHRLFQVLSNLLGNALKFTPPGGHVSVTVSVPASRRDEVRFEVSDSGLGIAPEHLPHVFDRFWQARSGARHGVGLGLAIARGLVEAHGGQIHVTSQAGRGSRFAFDLPGSVRPLPAADVPSPPAPSARLH